MRDETAANAMGVEMIKDKSGRWIGIHDKPGAWKISAHDRDVIYQSFRRFRQDNPSPKRARPIWLAEMARKYDISRKRIEDLIFEGDGGWGSPMQWWVGCSMRAAASSRQRVTDR